MSDELKTPQDVNDYIRRRNEEMRAAKASKYKNNSGETQVFHGEYDPHYFGELVKEPTAEEWLEAVRVYIGNPNGAAFVVGVKADGSLTLLHLGDFGIETGSKYLVPNPTAKQAAEAVNRFVNPGLTWEVVTTWTPDKLGGGCWWMHWVARRWDDNLSLFDKDLTLSSPVSSIRSSRQKAKSSWA